MPRRPQPPSAAREGCLNQRRRLRRHHHRQRRRRRHPRRQLAPSGKRILILERGDWLPRETENWDSKAVFVDNRYVPKETWYDHKASRSSPGIHYWVGGATKFYGAALYRLRPQDFGDLRHHDGISPAWPISYDEMEPYYTGAEQLYEVHGARRGLHRGPRPAPRIRSLRST